MSEDIKLRTAAMKEQKESLELVLTSKTCLNLSMTMRVASQAMMEGRSVMEKAKRILKEM